MSFFKKIKQGLGIGTAKVELEIPTSIPKDTKEIDGKVILTAQSDQKVKSINVRLVEKTVVVRDEERQYQTKDIQSTLLDDSFEIKKDEVRTIPFTLSVDLGDSASFEVFGGTLTISSSSDTSQNFEVVATVDMEGVALDPTASRAISFTEQT